MAAVLGFVLMTVGPAPAQDMAEPVPRIEQAEAVFQQALEAFDAQEYGMAYRRFRVVYNDYPLNRKTTAAVLMAGKALYRAAEYQRAIDLLTEFIRAYPTSSYLGEARRILNFAERALEDIQTTPPVVNVGIALPLTRDDVSFTQSLFDGIRLAVDAHNRTREPSVQMVFRDTENTARGARNAVIELASGADVIIGPLYSEEAEAAALAAERTGTVLIAPLATDESVSQGRRYVFQANPTISWRGVAMAQLAVENLQLRTFGIAAEQGNSISERMAEGFHQEALRLGGNVTFYELLPEARAWPELPERVGEEALRGVDAVYLPISGRNAHGYIERVLDGFEGLNVLPWVLGNSTWHNLAFADKASTFSVLYSDDFYVDAGQADVRAFQRAYRDLNGQDPDRLAYVGYDVMRFLLEQIAQESDAPLDDRLREAPRYEGLGMRIDFQENNANTALFFLQYRNGNTVLYR